MQQHWKEKVTLHVGTSRHPLIAVLGPTASGKTDFSLQIAQYVAEGCGSIRLTTGGSPLQNPWRGAEIINADSRQLYRYMDIGTAKIRPEEMLGFPHHLLDVLDPKEEATAAWYKIEATRIIEDIFDRGGVPILVGGSMLYISALLDDLQFISRTDPALRKNLEEQYDADGGVTLYAQLEAIDQETASAFTVKNKPYVIRAMEILKSTGTKPSLAKQSGTCPWDVLVFGLRWPRKELVSRIDARTKEMFHAGWVEEVRSFLTRGYTIEDPGMKSHGYRTIAAAIRNAEGGMRPTSPRLRGPGNAALLSLQESIAAKTRQYAKRQMTWWKHDRRIFWLEQSDLFNIPTP